MVMELTEIRVRSRIPKEELDKKVGKIITEQDYNVLMTGPTKVTLPNGKPLCIYLPKALLANEAEADKAYEILHPIKGKTQSRKMASGSEGMRRNKQNLSRVAVASNIIGNVDKMGRFPYCRTTAWTGTHTEQFSGLYPIFRLIAENFKEHVPDRFQNQMQRALATPSEWRVSDTPYTTMTVNNTYPTGVHKDAGDLDNGFSCLAVWRKGQYSGGKLTFPEYRISVDLQHGDLLLMDAHEWHGNTEMFLESEDAERISLVLYYRTKMLNCGTLEEESEIERKAKKGVFKKMSDEDMDSEAMKEFVMTSR